jgi:acetyltransferase-like isoleucine patch superfamily enzyme
MIAKPPVRIVRRKFAWLISAVKVAYYRIMGVSIGKGTTISLGAHIDVSRGEIVIGDNVGISHGTYILSHAGFRDIKQGEQTVIEDGVRIFVNAVILPGIRIGRNSTVGAGAVVMKNVPPNVVVAGNPARVVQQLSPDGPAKLDEGAPLPGQG